MSFVHGSKTRIYANGYDLSAFLKSVSGPSEMEMHDSTTFGATAKAYEPGIENATLSAEGLFSGAVGATDAVFHAALRGRTPVVWNWLPMGDIDGGFGYGLLAMETNYEIDSPTDDLVSVSVEAQSDVGRERVQILHPLAAETATGSGVSRDNAAAATATGGVGYLQVTTVSGTAPSMTVKIQHSADAVTWADLITFAAVTADNNAQRVTVTGTVERHVRAAWNITGTGPSFTFFTAFGRY